ncbi:bacteriocin [Streptococcus suis]|nr:bacteriocin [Streptococcus suis]NQO44571.1 bacteriocin [Streptococcus suis]NQO47108.1 bacteriocin [Streptococcus suis]WNF85541.1 bacteriocin [Streptococcus suis]HEL1700799.1 bacteriocin [Streptococcus suis]
MNKHNNCTMHHSLSTEELKNIIGGNRSDFWEILFPPNNKRRI